MRHSGLLQVATAASDVAFLTAFCFVKFLGKSKKDNIIRSDCPVRAVRAGCLYKATYASTLFLCMLNLLAAAWFCYCAVKKGWHCFALVEITAVLEVCVWYANSAETSTARLEKKASHSWILRIWWITCFFRTTLTLTFRALHWGTRDKLPLGALIDLLALPIFTFLCIAAVYGKTCLLVPALNVLDVPLLNSCSEKTARVTNYANANVVELATLSWLNSLLTLGYGKSLELDDIPQLAQKDSANFLSETFQACWTKLPDKHVVRCLALLAWKDVMLNAFFAGLCTCSSYVGPYLIDDFVEYLGGRRRFSHEGFVLTGVFFAAKLIQSLSQRQWYFGSQQIGMRATSALSAAIYRKGLSLPSETIGNHASGEVVNYIAVDVERVREFGWCLHDLWLLLLQISLALFILHRNLGLASLGTLAASVLIMVANLPVVSVLEKLQTNIMQAKDDRMRATSEALRTMRILKLHAWEVKYMRKIEELRRTECGSLRRFVYAEAGTVALSWCTPAIVGAITFSTCLLMGIPLTAGKVLSALATFEILEDPIYGLPDLIGMLSETKVSLQRIQKFLEEPEIDRKAVIRCVAENEERLAMEIHDACFSWDTSSLNPSLTVGRLQIRQGTKVAVCGQVGAGKSSLISCILGEMPKISGTVKVNGQVAYVAQTAWIQSGKVQDNILFGKHMDKQKYNSVLTACLLTKDLELFSHGDETEIGERGINLSGGQKQRIQLARALYQDADIYLLDDPFSAVDAHTGSTLFQECILGLLNRKTVLYVTHQMEFLRGADNILVLDNGIVTQAGTFSNLIKSDGKFLKLIRAHAKALESLENVDSPKISEETEEEVLCRRRTTELNEIKSMDSGILAGSLPLKQLVQEEGREKGKVHPAVYWSLARAAYGGALVPFLLLTQILFQVFQIASNYWMAFATAEDSDDSSTVSLKVLVVYIGLATASSLCILSRALLLAFISLKTAQKFFFEMLRSLFHAPMSFFDSTPASRILSRASTDQTALDLHVTERFAGLAFNTIQLAGIIFVMSQVTWQIFLLFIPVIIISLWLQNYYITSARELSRLVGIHESPIIHHFSESISGVATIRGFNQDSRFTNTNLNLIDCYCRPHFHNFAAMEWLCLRLNMISNIMFVLAMIFIVSLPSGTLDPSMAGLAVTYGLNLNYLQYMIIWNLCSFENTIISVERVKQYSLLPSEAPLIVQSCRPPTSWPSAGTITFENVQARYAAHLPLILCGITCTFLGGQKIGVVGRTGSGKTTLVQVLFRIIEPVAGRVLIDNWDIAQIGLHDLRSKLSIIPQDPTLFEGTVRENLDPLEEHTDADMWEALDKSQLGDFVRNNRDKLAAPVSEGGANWSVGQRQLLCLGRALLKRTRILVLDEATASVDSATDDIIQDTIRQKFSDCTVITIAHRVPTIIDSDRVLFVSDGRAAEYDSPERLLDDSSSLFAKLVAEYSRRSTHTPRHGSC